FRGGDGARHRVARHRHLREPARGLPLHRDDRVAPGPEGRLPRGDRLPHGLHRRGAARAPRRAHAQELLRPIPAGRPEGPGVLELPLSLQGGGWVRVILKAIPTAIPDVLVIEPKVYGDARGFFYESWNARVFDQVVGRKVAFV